MKAIYQKLKPFIDELKRKLLDHYGENLIDAIIFGSYARGEISVSSDLDILIVLEDVNLERRERQRVFEKNVEDKIEAPLTLPISPVILSETEAGNFHTLYLDIIDNHVILIGGRFLDRLKSEIDLLFREGLLEEKTLAGKKYWRIIDEEKIAERLSL